MDIAHIQHYAHKHCRFKLRSGKEVFGVVWDVVVAGRQRVFFASVRDYERLQRDPHKPVSVMDMQPEEIVHVERIAS